MDDADVSACHCHPGCTYYPWARGRVIGLVTQRAATSGLARLGPSVASFCSSDAPSLAVKGELGDQKSGTGTAVLSSELAGCEVRC